MKNRTKSIREKRAKTLIKHNWMDRTQWNKNTPYVQYLTRIQFNEEGD